MTPEEERQLAVDLFNQAWTLMELPERTPEQDDELIHASHASRHHWAAVGTPANLHSRNSISSLAVSVEKQTQWEERLRLRLVRRHRALRRC